MKNLTLMADGITTIVGEHGTLVSNKMFRKEDIGRLCVEFDYNVYSELQDDNIQLAVLFGMNTTKGMVMYPQFPKYDKMNARLSK